MLISVYTEKQVCMYFRMDRWMDARIYVRNFVCIINACVCVAVCVYMCGDMYGIYVHRNLCICVYMSDIFVYNVCIIIYVLTYTRVCVCVCVCMRVCVFVCIMSPVSKLDTDQCGVLVTR
jgi:hypothetical protein